MYGRLQSCLVSYFSTSLSWIDSNSTCTHIATASLVHSMFDSGCDELDYANACAAYGQGVSVSRMGPCTTTSSVATESSGGTSTVMAATDGVACQVGPSADPALGCATEGEFCQLDTGVCNNKSGIHDGVCVTIPQVCTEEYNPAW